MTLDEREKHYEARCMAAWRRVCGDDDNTHQEDDMSYRPRIDAHGRECCTHVNADGAKGYGLRSASGHLTACDACRAHHAGLTAAEDYTAPDPYAAGLRALRASETRVASERAQTPTPRPTETPLDSNGIPDGYAAGLAAMKKENR